MASCLKAGLSSTIYKQLAPGEKVLTGPQCPETRSPARWVRSTADSDVGRELGPDTATHVNPPDLLGDEGRCSPDQRTVKRHLHF